MNIMQPKPILAFDCSTSPASVALRVGDRILEEGIPHGRQAAELLPAIQRLMRAGGVNFSALDSIITTVGPGSFTGIRIGLAALHGLILANPTPVRLLTASEAVALTVAAKAEVPEEFAVVLDAGKAECFVQIFSIKEGFPEERSGITIHSQSYVDKFSQPSFGNLYALDEPNYISGPNAATMLKFAERIAMKPLSEAVPYYIREPDAKMPAALG